MAHIPHFSIIVLIFLFSSILRAELVAQSPETKVSLVELFSSESCSSCPPADQWFSRLQGKPNLWKTYVPVVFHVDYWNHLNWKDEFSSREKTDRQRAHVSKWTVKRVYTPGVMINGQEWQGWARVAEPPVQPSADPGVLAVEKEGSSFSVSFKPKRKPLKSVRLNIALLGMGVKTKVTAGENLGRDLVHDFIVLTWVHRVVESDQNGEFKFSFSDLNSKKVRSSTAIAAWVEEPNSPTPLQSVGGFLK